MVIFDSDVEIGTVHIPYMDHTINANGLFIIFIIKCYLKFHNCY
jgi:hypothetical protein